MVADEWSWDRQRLARIRYKKTLADAAVDGLVPEAKLASPGINAGGGQEGTWLPGLSGWPKESHERP